MKTLVDFAIAVLAPALYALLLAGAVLGLVIGVMLLVDSARVLRWNSAMNRWVSTRQALRPLEEPHDIKRAVYRWHRAVGVVVFAGALYTLDVLCFHYQTGPLVRGFRDLGNPGLLAIVFDSARAILIAGNAAAVLAGLVLCFRPSLLKGVESSGDHVYSGRLATRPLEIMRYEPDRLVGARPRLAGVLLILGSLYVLVFLGAALL
jgi:hypothetical protein